MWVGEDKTLFHVLLPTGAWQRQDLSYWEYIAAHVLQARTGHFTAWFLSLEPLIAVTCLSLTICFVVVYNIEKFVCPLWTTFWSFLIIYSYLSKPKSLKWLELSKNKNFCLLTIRHLCLLSEIVLAASTVQVPHSFYIRSFPQHVQ